MSSPSQALAPIAVKTGERLTSRLAVPAGTVRSPEFSSSWYAVMPASATAAIAGRSRRAGSPDAARRGDRAQDERSDKEPEDGQVSGAEMLERGPDRRERRAPEHYGGGEREGRADGHGSTVSSTGRQHK
jgi:hypothetical protein